MIDLRRLRMLRAVDHYGTVTAAARALYVTPSAASQQIRQLGRELGVTLLEPDGRRVRLTHAALGLLIHVEAIEEHWQRAEAELAAAGPDAALSGSLRLCGIPTALAALLVPAAVRLRELHPRLTASIREAEPQECFDLVFAGVADLAITMAAPAGPPLTDPRFEQRPLLDDPYDLLTASDHPLAGRPGVTLESCAFEPWIVSMPDTTYRHMVVALCTAAGFTPTIAHEVLDWTAVATLVGHGLGISLIHRLARLPADPPVVRTPLAAHGAPSRRLLAVIRRGSHTRPGITAALAVLTDLAAEHDAARPAPPRECGVS